MRENFSIFSSLWPHFVHQTDDGGSALANCTVLADTIFLQEGEVLLATDLAPPSDSDFLLLPAERTEDRLPSLGAVPSRSLRATLWPESEWTKGGRLLRGMDSGSITADCGVAGACFFSDKKPPNFPALKLGALLLRRLGALRDGGLQL